MVTFIRKASKKEDAAKATSSFGFYWSAYNLSIRLSNLSSVLLAKSIRAGKPGAFLSKLDTAFTMCFRKAFTASRFFCLAVSISLFPATDVRFRPPWPYQDLFCLLFGGIQTEFEPFIRSQLAPPFLGHLHDLSDTRYFFNRINTKKRAAAQR